MDNRDIALDWNDVRFFLGVARSGSLTRTAGDLRVSQSTVSRRIAAFEASLGVVLFAHHQTGYLLTEEGRKVLSLAERVEDGVVTLECGAAGLEKVPKGKVRLATSETLATDLIIPAMPLFRKRYPEVCVEIITGTGMAELARREADIALRLVQPTHGNLKVRRVGHMTYSVYGTSEYLEHHPAVEGEPLDGRHVIAWDDAHAHLPTAAWLAREHPGCRIALVTSSLAGQIAAVRAGLGLAVLPDFLAVANDLVRVIPSDRLFSDELWLVTHADLIASVRVRAVSNFLSDHVVGSNAQLDCGRRI